MKTLDTLAAIGAMTLVYIGCKVVLAANEVFRGPNRKELKSKISFTKKGEAGLK